MVGPRRALVRQTSRKKGLKVGLAAGGTAALFAFVAPWAGVIGLAGSAWLAYDWLRFRGKNGLKF